MGTSIDALPKEILIDVLGRVASSSFRNLRSAILSWKNFSDVANEDSIYRQVSLEGFPIVQWHEENNRISNFLAKCRRSKNLEALFRKAVVDYFGGKDPKKAFECLEEVAKNGHGGARYTQAMILLLSGGEMKQKGVKLLTEMKKSRIQKRDINSSRQRLKNILNSIWVKNSAILNQPRPTFCTAHHRRNRKDSWGNDDNNLCEEDNDCDGCSCDEEIILICDALPQIIH